MQKTERQNAILGIIAAADIARQDELVDRLRAEGFAVTQASISRDLDELGIVKVNGSYSQPQTPTDAFTFGLVSLEAAGPNLLIARCASGLASASAVRIDRARFQEIVGTIAGDDTIFIAVRSEKEQKTLTRKLWELFKG